MVSVAVQLHATCPEMQDHLVISTAWLVCMNPIEYTGFPLPSPGFLFNQLLQAQCAWSSCSCCWQLHTFVSSFCFILAFTVTWRDPPPSIPDAPAESSLGTASPARPDTGAQGLEAALSSRGARRSWLLVVLPPSGLPQATLAAPSRLAAQLELLALNQDQQSIGSFKVSGTSG